VKFTDPESKEEAKVEIEEEPEKKTEEENVVNIYLILWTFAWAIVQIMAWIMYAKYQNLRGKCGRPIGTWMLVQLIIWAVITLIDVASIINQF